MTKLQALNKALGYLDALQFALEDEAVEIHRFGFDDYEAGVRKVGEVRFALSEIKNLK